MATIKETADNFFQRAKFLYYEKAQQISQNEYKVKKLIKSASEKLQKFADNPTVLELAGHINVIIRMIKAQTSGSYKGVSTKSMGLMVLALIYFITPVDLIPDFIPVIGYVDDLSVLLAVVKSIQTDIERFMLWEKSHLN
jgi:uncharacterized membrane protein YkvA (DUF1232 family)